MSSQVWSRAAFAALVVGALLACKKKEKSEESSSTTPSAEQAPAASPLDEPEPPAPTKTFNVGDVATAKDYTLKVLNVKECKPKGFTTKAKKGNIFLGAEVLIESTAADTFLASPAQAKIVDSQGIATNYHYLYKSTCEPRLDSATQLQKGEKATGWITFEIPKDANGLKLSYTPSRYKGQTVKFDLGR